MVFHSNAPRALITGLSGFTGRFLARELADAGYRVFGTTFGSESVEPDMYKLDLCDYYELVHVVTEIQPDVVAHLAAVSFVAHDDVESIYRTNVVGTRNLLSALTHLTVRPRVVLLSSSANVYGDTGCAEVVDESVVPNPANDYAVSKLAMEYMARLWTGLLPIVVVRPFNYTGVGQSPEFVLPRIVSHFQRRERVIELGNIDIERDFSDVRMVAAAYRRLIELAPAGETFNVCSGTAISLKSILSMMAEIAGYQIDVRVNPVFVRVNEVRRLLGDPGKLNAAVGSVKIVPMAEILRWMYCDG